MWGITKQQDTVAAPARTHRSPGSGPVRAALGLIMALGLVAAACSSEPNDTAQNDAAQREQSAPDADMPAVGEAPAEGEAFDDAEETAGDEEPRFPDAVTFADYGVGGFVDTADLATSTFATDADTASYALAQAWVQNEGVLPPAEAIRAEEWINALDHRYPDPADGETWAIVTDVGEPWWDVASVPETTEPAEPDDDVAEPAEPDDDVAEPAEPQDDVADPVEPAMPDDDVTRPDSSGSPEQAPMTEEELDEMIENAEPMPMPTVPDNGADDGVNDQVQDAPADGVDVVDPEEVPEPQPDDMPAPEPGVEPEPAPEPEPDPQPGVELPPSSFADGDTQLLRVGLQGQRSVERAPVSVTLVIDTSGSMSMGNRVELVKDAVDGLLNELDEGDQVAVVEYGTQAQTVVEPTGEFAAVGDAVASLTPNGSTNAEAGLTQGYDVADQGFREDTNNVVVFFSDGVANVGATDSGGIMERIGEEAADGIMLHSVGVGMDNFNDVLLERIANDAGGAYAYIDSPDQAADLFTGALPVLTPLAHDVKAQVDFNDDVVQSWRLIGYENRLLNEEDFRDDEVGGGYVGAGHAVTALYEVVADESADDWGTVTVRWADPGSEEVSEMSDSITPSAPEGEMAVTFESGAATAAAAEYLRGSPFAVVDIDDVESQLSASSEAQDAELADLLSAGAPQPGSSPRQEVLPPDIDVEDHTS